MAENKIEAVLSFKLDPTGLKDAEKELENLEKQLKDLNEQQVSAGPGKGSPETAKQIADTEKAIKLNKLQQGDPEAAKEFQGAFEKQLGGRNPSKTFTDNFEKAVTGALKELFGNVGTPEAKQRIVDAMVEAVPTKERPAGNPKARSEEENEKAKARRAENPLQLQINPPEEKKPPRAAQGSPEEEDPGRRYYENPPLTVTPEAAQAASGREDEGNHGVQKPKPSAYTPEAVQAAPAREDEGYHGVKNTPSAITPDALQNAPEQEDPGRRYYEKPPLTDFSPKALQGVPRREDEGRKPPGRPVANESGFDTTLDYNPFTGLNVDTTAPTKTDVYDAIHQKKERDAVQSLPELTEYNYTVPHDPSIDHNPFPTKSTLSHEPTFDPFTGTTIDTPPVHLPTDKEVQQAVTDRKEREAKAEEERKKQAEAEAEAEAARKEAAFRATAGPESFIANPLDVKGKQSPTVKASQNLANNMVKGALTEHAEAEKTTTKEAKTKADALEKEAKAKAVELEKEEKARKEVAEKAMAAEASYTSSLAAVALLKPAPAVPPATPPKVPPAPPTVPPVTPPPTVPPVTPPPTVPPVTPPPTVPPVTPPPTVPPVTPPKVPPAPPTVPPVTPPPTVPPVTPPPTVPPVTPPKAPPVPPPPKVPPPPVVLTPDKARDTANLLQDAYSKQQGVLKDATKISDTAAISDATNKLSALSKAAQDLNQSFTGTAKSSDSFQKSLKTVNHAADLIEERSTLKQNMADEPDKDMRRQYAHALNLNTQKLVPLTADPDERRAINKENVQRSKDYGLQSDMMASFGQFLAGNVLMSVGRGARAPYTAANQSFDQFNQQHQIDPVLLSSQRANQAAMLGLGEQFQSYNLFKNSLAHAAITNPAAGVGAVVGDIGGAIAGPAGSMLQTGASLKMAATDSKAVNTLLGVGSGAGILGLAGLAGGAAGLGLGALLTNLGPDKKDPFKALQSFFDPKGLSANETQQRFGADIQKLTGSQLMQVSNEVDKASDALTEYSKAQDDYDSRRGAKDRKTSPTNPYIGPIGSKQATVDSGIDTSDSALANSKDAQEKALKKLGDEADKIAHLTNGTGLTDAEKGNAEYLKGFIQTFQESLLKGGSDAVKKFQQIIDSDPVFKLQQKQMNQQRADTQQDEQRSRQQLDRSYARQQEDFTKSRTRSKEDFNVNEQRLGVSRTRAAEDFTLANQQNDRGYYRTTRDIGTSLQREGEDQTRQRSRQYQDYDRSMGRMVENRDTSVYRLQRDTSRTMERTTEDVSRSTGRALEDAGRTVQRAQEDSARTWQRSVEDTSRTWQRTNEDASRTLSRAFEDASITLGRAAQDFGKSASRAIEDASTSRSRLSQDYNREVTQQNKSYQRSTQDMNQSYQDSVLGIVAPGLASNPAYQLMKLTRDYTKNQGRAAEDYQQGRTDLNTSTDRQFADIAKSLKRGLDDMTQSFQRTLDDVGKSLSRTTEDVNTTLSRTAEDIATTLSRTSEDLATSLSRTMEDTVTSISRMMQDSATTMQRATQDTATALSDGMIDINKNFSQGVEDLNTSLTRAIQDLDTSDFRARFDAMRALDDAKIDYETNRNKLQVDYNRQIEDLNNAEYDMRKEYNRNLDDLNTAQQRATQDYQTASDGLNIQIARATRDFEDASTSFVMSVASAAGLIGSYNTQIANATVNPPSNGGGDNGSGGGSFATGLDRVPADEFPARLHKGEMVVTAQESEVLRQAGYQPASKNLDQALKNMFHQAMPGYADGNNGTASWDVKGAVPAVAEPYWKSGHPEWEPGKGAKWLEAQAAGSNVIKPMTFNTPVPTYEQTLAQNGGKSPYKIWNNMGNQMVTPDGQGGDSAHPNKISPDQGRKMADAMWDRIHHPDPGQPYFVPGNAGGLHLDPSSSWGYSYTPPTPAHTVYPDGTTAADWQTDDSRLYNPDRSQPTYLMTSNNPNYATPNYPEGNRVTSSRPDWHQPGETMGFPSKEAFYGANPQWAPGTGSEWLKNKEAQNTHNYLPGNYPDPGMNYTNGQGQQFHYASMAAFYAAQGGPGSNGAATNSIASGIGTPQALTNTSTHGIIRATNNIVPPAAATSGSPSSSSARFGNVSVSVNVSGAGNSRLQQILNQSAQAFARSLASKDLSIV